MSLWRNTTGCNDNGLFDPIAVEPERRDFFFIPMHVRRSVADMSHSAPICGTVIAGRAGRILRHSSRRSASGLHRHASGISIRRLSAFALHRFVREPLELDCKWMRKAHLALRHDQARDILFGRNPPLGACASAPKELAFRILMLEGSRLQQQRTRERVPLALKFSVSSKAYPHTLR